MVFKSNLTEFWLKEKKLALWKKFTYAWFLGKFFLKNEASYCL